MPPPTDVDPDLEEWNRRYLEYTAAHDTIDEGVWKGDVADDVTWEYWASFGRSQGGGTCETYGAVGTIEVQYMLNNCEYYLDEHPMVDGSAPCPVNPWNDDPSGVPFLVCPSPWPDGNHMGLDLSEHIVNSCTWSGYSDAGVGPEGPEMPWMEQIGTTLEVYVAEGMPYQEWLHHATWPPPRSAEPRVLEGWRLGTCALVDRDNPGEAGSGTCDVQDLLALTSPPDWGLEWPFWCYPWLAFDPPAGQTLEEPTTPVFFRIPPGGRWETVQPTSMFDMLEAGYALRSCGDGHCYTVIGYHDNDHDNVPSAPDTFVIRNSWGDAGGGVVSRGWYGVGISPASYILGGTVETYWGCETEPLLGWRQQDADGDTIPNGVDVCLWSPNGTADGLEPQPRWHYSLDEDGWPDSVTVSGGRTRPGCDNCPGIPAAERRDMDGDGLGNPCDGCLHVSAIDHPEVCGGGAVAPVVFDVWNDGDWDIDGDGVPEGDGFLQCCDGCPFHPVHDATDDDRDGRFNRCDACPDGHSSGSDNCDPDIDGFHDDPACSCGTTGTEWRCHNPIVLDNCPGVPNWEVTARWCVQPDGDSDGSGDQCDNCPGIANPGGPDIDLDGIGDACDVCPQDARTDDLPPLDSSEYDATPGVQDPEGLGDLDGDDVGDRCDLCPTMSAYRDGVSRVNEQAWIPREGGSSTLPGVTTAHPHDLDRDGIGLRCDNCPDHPNRDQWNCNAAWERVYPPSAPSLLDPPMPFRVGVGDACDSDWPCIDSCVAPERQPTLHVERMEGDERYWTPPHWPTAWVDVCPTWKNRDPEDYSLLGPPVDTLVQRCHCDQTEREDGTCERFLCPPNVPEDTGRWKDASHDAALLDPSGDILPAPYQYQELYHDDPDLGVLGRRGSFLGYAAFWAAGRSTRQEWNWQEDLCEDGDVSPCRADVQMWFRPLPTTGTAFTGPGYGPAFGNTYTRWTGVDGEGLESGLPPGTMHPPFGAGGGGATGVTIPWVMDDTGRIGRNTNTLLDILRVRCFAEWGPCPGWPGWMFFESAGDEVAGLAVSSWSASSNDLGWTLGTKLASPSAVFDLTEPAASFAFDTNGDPYRFWAFGGVDASGQSSDQMWAGAMTVRDAWGFERRVEAAGLPVELTADGRPDPERTFFSLSPVARSNIWPAARHGAVLACTGFGSSAAAGCDGQCPQMEVALGLEPPPDGNLEPTGSLLLVGGEGDGGPFSDIWLYEERATWIPPSDVVAGDEGPWVSGWRRVGELPNVAGGLADPGITQVGRTLWLVGGRTADGPTSDLYRVDLESGAATRIAAVAGPAGRVAPAVAYDPARARLVVFGGSDASNRAVADLWYVDPITGTWSLAAAPCVGDGCPPAGGRTALSVNRPTSEVTVVADRGVSTPATSAWTLRSGIWESLGERRGDLATADCDGDDAPEPLHGARCAVGPTGGFPEFGRFRCGGDILSCRTPAAPAVVVAERRTRDLAAVVTQGGEVFALRGAQVEVFRIGPTGEIVPARTLHLRGGAHDLAAAPGVLLAAHASEVSLYGIADGTLLATIDTCGKPRRVFIDGRRAYIVGLLSVVVADVSEPAAPVVLGRFRLVPGPGGLDLRSCSSCGWFDRGVDRLCDALGGCGAFGRTAAAYDRGLLFLHLFGMLHVLDLRDGPGPTVEASVPVGLAREVRVEGDFVYVLRPFRQGLVVRRSRAGEWSVAGPHDVWRWVDAALDVGPWTLHWEPGHLQVATRQ
ncbi:MAG: hypothetical protein JXB32_26260 [Deltaproteobacteria bacterium]|nr:hypothetical protein [Deltaproteobacteria bacterium]